MKKLILALFLAGMMVASCTMAAMAADNADPAQAIQAGGEDAGTSLGESAGDSSTENSGTNSGSLLSSLMSVLANPDGSLNFDAILGYMEIDPDFEVKFSADEEVKKALYEALEAEIRNTWGIYYEASEVSFFVPVTAALESSEDNSTVRIMGDFCLLNYNPEEAKLVLASGGEFPGLLVFEKQEDGSYLCTEKKYAEDGTDVISSLTALSEEIGITYEQYEKTASDRDTWIVKAFKEYLEEHPEYESIEWDGEELTLKDLTSKYSNSMRDMVLNSLAGNTEDLTSALGGLFSDMGEASEGLVDNVSGIAENLSDLFSGVTEGTEDLGSGLGNIIAGLGNSSGEQNQESEEEAPEGLDLGDLGNLDLGDLGDLDLGDLDLSGLGESLGDSSGN